MELSEIITYDQYYSLCEEINYHMDAYYNLDEPVISDYEYDQLMQKLKSIEKQHPEWITPDSPSQKIGGVAKRTAGVKVSHNVPMLSIEDVFTLDDVSAWVDKVKMIHPDCTFSVETKIDGLSMTLRYEKKEDGNLHLILAETRGDGITGEDVTANALVIPDVKKVIELPYDFLEIRGEVYMTHKDYEKYNLKQEDEGKKTAANPRNLAAGTLRQLDPSVTKQRGLHMFIFNVQDGPKEIMTSHVKGMELLSKCGVPVTYHALCSTKEEIIKIISKIGEMRSKLPYDIDGAVVKIDQIDKRNDFPAGSKYSSGHIAYKYPPEEKVVTIDDILVDVGRTGKLTFTAEFHDSETGKPARLCGTSVSRATVHNIDYIKGMHVGIGGQYKLFKSGEIIPKLNGCVTEPIAVYEAPDKCPVCGGKLIREDETADIKCINPFCKVRISRTISYFASVDAMDIAGLGEKIVNELLNQGYLNDYADIYYLKDYRDELIEKGIIGKAKNTDKILDAIEKSKENNVYKLLTGLGINNVGKVLSRELMKNFTSLNQLMAADAEELIKIDDVGNTTAECIVRFFSDAANKKIIEKLETAGVNMLAWDDSLVSSKLKGLKFVITGTLPHYERNEIEKIILDNGGKYSSSVSKKTSYVVAGDGAGTKLTKAEELGIKVISESEFEELIK